MSNKKARYKVGDTVVIKKYGTVGKITDIKFPLILGGQDKTLQVGENYYGVGSNLFTLIKK